MNSSTPTKSIPSPTPWPTREHPFNSASPRVALNLLDYTPDAQSFKPKTSVHLWTGGEWPEWKVRYKLFKKFGVINPRLYRADARRAARHEREEASSSGGKKRKRASKTPTPIIVVIGQSSRPT